MKNELPLALVEEQAEGEITAEESRDDGDGDSLDEPEGAYNFRGNVGWLGTFAGLRCGAGHE